MVKVAGFTTLESNISVDSTPFNRNSVSNYPGFSTPQFTFSALGYLTSKADLGALKLLLFSTFLVLEHNKYQKKPFKLLK